MTEYFRIEGLNTIDFDRLAVTRALPLYCLIPDRPPADMSKSLTRQEIIAQLPRLPLGVRGHALNRGMSMITFPFDIQAASNVEMEQALHDLKRTLNEAQLHIESEQARGTRAVLRYKNNAAVQTSYKTIYYGYITEASARDVLGPKVKESYLEGLQLTLYMEPNWRPASAIELGPNEIYCPGMEEDGNADGLADNWVIVNLPTLTMESTIVLQGFYSQKVVTRNLVGDGIQSATFVAALDGSAVCYAWICRPAAAPSNIIVDLYDVTAAGVITSALYDTAGWDTATAKDGTSIFKRVKLSTAAGIVGGNTYRMRIRNTQDTATTFYVDKCYWKFGVTVVPDEWCDHLRVYNHYDTTESAAHVGHQNYFDVADLKGTDEARLLVRVAHPWIADKTYHADLIVARRTWWDHPEPDVVRDVHWLEAEDAPVGTRSNWANLGGLARCSAGECVSNGPAGATTGSVLWPFYNPVVAPPQLRSDSIKGRWDVFGVVYTDDEIHTEYRLSYTNLGATLFFYNDWVKQSNDLQWQMIYLGEVNFDKFLRNHQPAHNCQIMVEYAKDAADTVRLDCIWLLPKAEPETRLRVSDNDWAYYVDDLWVFSRDEDFDYEEKERWAPPDYVTMGELCLQGDEIGLTPNKVVGQRLYMSAQSVDTAPAPDERIWEAHGAGTLALEVHVSYLPQFQTPLD